MPGVDIIMFDDPLLVAEEASAKQLTPDGNSGPVTLQLLALIAHQLTVNCSPTFLVVELLPDAVHVSETFGLTGDAVGLKVVLRAVLRVVVIVLSAAIKESNAALNEAINALNNELEVVGLVTVGVVAGVVAGVVTGTGAPPPSISALADVVGVLTAMDTVSIVNNVNSLIFINLNFYPYIN